MTTTNLHLHLQSPVFHLSKPHQICEFRVWRRRRLKLDNTRNTPRLQCQLNDDPNSFQNFISHFSSLDVIAPAVGFATGVSIYISQLNKKSNKYLQLPGEWILFTNPTPFNRFVLLRCPSITFEGSELLEDVNHKLVTEERHFVRIEQTNLNRKIDNQKLVYQRVYVPCEDGGVISLDWPANFDLTEERGMDTTLLLVPGTAQGSMDMNVRSFAYEALRRGCFPIVMNPRGCAGSALTTPRLFTAADSDDICTAIQFINNARPWTTMMAVGWGYGANMLTKYLAEVAERTPLTAATCIDNPFDLEEVTQSSRHHVALDQKLLNGLRDILRSNKELFQGKAKNFNVQKALSATSVRDFEREISMISHGCESIEEFYSKSCTRELVGSLKVPVLFIQSDDGTVPAFSIPRSSIAENPFTSLLLYSCLSSTAVTSEISPESWFQHFAFEWLTAVELGLLKGRHPLLKDVDVTINPSKGLALVEGRASDKNSVNKMNALNGLPIDPISYMHDGSDRIGAVRLGSWKISPEGAESQVDNNGIAVQSSSVDAEFVQDTGDNPIDNERSEVLQTAQVVMNMLDVTMPGTLAEEEKKKVLTAMEQGETLVKALQGAVPEDVRGKLTAAVSEIMQNKRKNLNLDGLMRIAQIPNVSSKLKLNNEEKDVSSSVGGYDDARSSEQMKMGEEMLGSTDKKQNSNGKPSEEPESDSQNLQKPLDLGQSQAEGSQGQGEFSKEPQTFGNDENGSAMDTNPNKHGGAEKPTESDNVISKQDRINEDNGTAQVSTNDANGVPKNEQKAMNISTDQDSLTTAKTEESLSPTASSAPPLIEKRSDQHIQNVVEENIQSFDKSEEPAPSNLPTSNPPSLSVSQALDALSGFDDSTQVAVNSVFGVLEGMIDQFEEEKEQENVEKLDENEDGKSSSASEASSFDSETQSVPGNEEHIENGSNLESDLLKRQTNPVQNFSEKFPVSHQDASNGWDEKELSQSCAPYSENSVSRSHGNDLSNHVDKEKGKQRIKNLISSKYSGESLDKIRHVEKIPHYVTVNPYGDSLYNEYLRRYLLSKLPDEKSLDLDSTTCLLLDYFPEDGQWKLLDQLENSGDSVGSAGSHKSTDGRGQVISSSAHANDTPEIIETSYVVLNNVNEQKPIKEYKADACLNENSEQDSARSEELVKFVKNIVFDTLKVEVCRRLGLTQIKQMESGLVHDLERVAEEVSLGVEHNEDGTWSLEGKEFALEKVGTLSGEHVIRKISLAIKDASYLRKVLPVGVIVGSILASLRKHFNVATQHDNDHSGASNGQGHNSGEKFYGQVDEIHNVDRLISNKGQYSGFESSVNESYEAIKKNGVMVGAFTAALGASALLVHQQGKNPYRDENTEVTSGPLSEKVSHHKVQNKLLDAVPDKSQNNIVSSLAEKAMSVAGPVVPTKDGGGVDQERLVAMLADWGQKGGMLRLVGKLALLWGGIRGAMSLTERLMSFLRIADRPLVQRILGFACMVLVLWSPVVIPLFPTLVQSWGAHNSTGIAVYASIIGLYTAMMILIMIWGKRIRGYKDPFQQYGLDLTAGRIYDFSKGLMGGVSLVFSIHSINLLLGYAHLSWSSRLPSSSLDVMAWLRVCGRMLMVAGQGIVTATIVATVEELLFRSWLPEEIAVDLGYHRAIIISGFAFAILQRSPGAIPGLWLFSIALSGARERSKGNLSIPIGMHAGIVASSFFLKAGGFLVYHPHCSQWLIGKHPLQPFGGVVGMILCLIIAILWYPRQLHWNAIRGK